MAQGMHFLSALGFHIILSSQNLEYTFSYAWKQPRLPLSTSLFINEIPRFKTREKLLD